MSAEVLPGAAGVVPGDTFATYAETLVARALGVPKKSVAAARRSGGLARPGDWVLVDSCVAYTPVGVSRICAALGLDGGPSVGRIMAARAQGVALPAGVDEGQEPGVEETEGSTAKGWSGPGPRKISEVVQESVAAQVSQPVEIVVVRLSPNARILHGECKVDGRAVTVVVRDNQNFRRGMVIKADPVNPHVFRMLGRCPRWPGRW